MTKAQKELVEEKAAVDAEIATITNYFSLNDYSESKDGEKTELRTSYAKLSARQKELEELISEFPKKEK